MKSASVDYRCSKDRKAGEPFGEMPAEFTAENGGDRARCTGFIMSWVKVPLRCVLCLVLVYYLLCYINTNPTLPKSRPRFVLGLPKKVS